MGWIIYLSTSVALLAMAWMIRKFLAEPKWQVVAMGVVVSLMWGGCAGYFFCTPIREFRKPSGWCLVGVEQPSICPPTMLRDTGVPLVWRQETIHPSFPQLLQYEEEMVFLAMDFLLWLLPGLAFWLLLLLCKPKAQPVRRRKPESKSVQAPACHTNG